MVNTIHIGKPEISTGQKIINWLARPIPSEKLSNIQDVVWRQCILSTLFSCSSWFGKTV